MSNFSPYSNFGYAALAKEATEGVAVTPTEYFRIDSESITPSFNINSVQEVAGDRERNVRSVAGKIEIAGDVTFNVEPKIIGHFFRALFGAPTTQELTASLAYRHVFEVTDTPKTYTLDVQPGDAPWIHRYYGVKINKEAFSEQDNKIQCVASTMPTKAFINARITTAAASGTTLLVDQTSGLTTDDTLLVLDKADGFTTLKELTITSIDSETQLTVSTIDVSLDVDDLIVIKRGTPSYDQCEVFTWLGGSQVFTGDDIDNLTASDKEGFALEYNNEVEAKWAAGIEESARYPSNILTKGYFATGNLSRFYDNELNLDKLRKNENFGVRVFMQGETALEANSAVKAKTVYGTGNGFSIEASTAGKAGNDINVTFAINTSDTLSASKDGNNIVILLADTTSSNNTGTLIAAAVDALSGVDSVAVGTGAEEFTTAIDNNNLGFYAGAASVVVGRDASEKPYIQFDHAAAAIDPYFVNNSEDSIVMEEIPLTFYKDASCVTGAKKWSTRIFLTNSVTSY
jgi:hypothetical protein